MQFNLQPPDFKAAKQMGKILGVSLSGNVYYLLCYALKFKSGFNLCSKVIKKTQYKEPFIKIIFVVRFANANPVSVILPSCLLNKLEDTKSTEALPILGRETRNGCLIEQASGYFTLGGFKSQPQQ